MGNLESTAKNILEHHALNLAQREIQARKTIEPKICAVQLAIPDTVCLEMAELRNMPLLRPDLSEPKHIEAAFNIHNEIAEISEKISSDIARRKSREERPKILIAPTKAVIDRPITGKDIGILIYSLSETEKSDLVDLTNNKTTFKNSPRDKIELLAAIIAVTYLDSKNKFRLMASDELRLWIKDTLAKSDQYQELPIRIGGATGFCGAHSRFLGVDATIVNLGKFQEGIKNILPKDLAVISADGMEVPASEIEEDKGNPGHFDLSIRPNSLNLSSIKNRLKLFDSTGQEVDLDQHKAVDIIINGTTSTFGFGDLTNQQIKEIANGKSAVIMSGAKDIVDDESLDQYIKSLKLLQSAGTAVYLLQSSPKKPEFEPLMLKAFKEARCVDMISMNVDEAYQLLIQIGKSLENNNPLNITEEQKTRIDVALENANLQVAPWGINEKPSVPSRIAALLQEITEIPAVRVRSRHIDIIVTDSSLNLSAAEFNKTRQDQMASRVLAPLKAATRGNSLVDENDVPLPTDPATAESLLAFIALGRYLGRYEEQYTKNSANATQSYQVEHPHNLRDDLSSFSEQQVRHFYEKGLYRLPDKRTLIASPTVSVEKNEGTVSMGDFIDLIFVAQNTDKTGDLDNILKKCSDLNKARRSVSETRKELASS